VYQRIARDSLAAAKAAEERIAELEAEVQRLMMEPRGAERVTLRLQGLFAAPEAGPASTIPLATTLPPGCTMLEAVVPMYMIEQEYAQLTSAVLSGGTAITAGQRDQRRKQLKVDLKKDPTGLPFGDLLRPALEAACPGRHLAEANSITSLEGCTQQKVHYDYDPDHVQCLPPPQKPRSAILSLRPGTRLIVYDSTLEHLVLVPVEPGSILLFDGDVAHAGAAYHAENTRVHVYLDVAGVDRKADYTWIKI